MLVIGYIKGTRTPGAEHEFYTVQRKYVELPTDAIYDVINEAMAIQYLDDGRDIIEMTHNALQQLRDLVDVVREEDAQIVELERRITDIHRHYVKKIRRLK